MPKVLEVVRDGQHAGWMIICPACGNGHLFDKRWTFNGNQESPTFMPSMLVYSAEPDPVTGQQRPTICHSFVTDGKIQFLSDCTHGKKDQTLPLEEFPLKDWQAP